MDVSVQAFNANTLNSRHEYIQLSISKLTDHLDKRGLSRLQELELKLDVTCIVLYRTVARDKAPKKPASSSSWFGSFFGSSKPADQDEEIDLEAAKQQVLATMDGEAAFETSSDENYTNAVVTLSLPCMFFELTDDTGGDEVSLVRGQALGMQVQCQQRSAAQALGVKFNVHDIELSLVSSRDSRQPAIVRRQHASEDLLCVQLEINPPQDKKSKVKVHTSVVVRQKPIEIIVSKVMPVEFPWDFVNNGC